MHLLKRIKRRLRRRLRRSILNMQKKMPKNERIHMKDKKENTHRRRRTHRRKSHKGMKKLSE